uniref:Uncharacterized protein n=1 Tax=Cacopsylla melanoneura TaxID=428564 RepID=A0A8D8U692_9HEMI
MIFYLILNWFIVYIPSSGKISHFFKLLRLVSLSWLKFFSHLEHSPLAFRCIFSQVCWHCVKVLELTTFNQNLFASYNNSFLLIYTARLGLNSPIIPAVNTIVTCGKISN